MQQHIDQQKLTTKCTIDHRDPIPTEFARKFIDAMKLDKKKLEYSSKPEV